ncbi:MAG: ATP-dependent sacrificial sulfur transferase LarE [Thermofilaceae archaeon]
MTSPGSQPNKLERLIEWFKELGGPVVVAFSGGVDSSLVLKAAAEALGPSQVYAVTVESPLHPASEIRVAREVASRLGVNHVVVRGDELEDDNVVSNPPNRCYYCKKRIVAKMKEVAARVGAVAIVDGTNAEDLMGHRPGLKALREEGVRSPLLELGFTKSEVRAAARALGLPNWDKPSAACLASRIPYGVRITVDKLSRIERAEELVRAITGARVVRVRDHGDVARIEVGREERKLLFSEDIMDALARELKSLGWRYVALDLEGYRTGSMDEVLERAAAPEA